MRILLFSLTMIAFLMVSCGENRQTNKEMPLQHSDQTYTLVKSGDGKKLEAGSFSIFSLMIKGDDGRILLDRSQKENYGKFQIPKDSSEYRQGSPVDELLTLLVEGDSAVLVYLLDSLEKMNPAVEGLTSISYEISIRETLTLDEMEAKTEVENAAKEVSMAEAKKLEEAIANRTSEVLDMYKSGTLGTELKKTESGLEYIVEKQGDGAIPKIGDLCAVHYYGVLESNGEMFDNSYNRGEAFSFPVGQGRVIKGWDEALLIMNKGTSAVFFIPYELAYGAAGRPPRIPEQAKLVFYIDYQ